jgi:hypothetical protein
MKLKMPFITTSKYIDVHVYVDHPALDKCKFIDVTHRVKKKQMDPLKDSREKPNISTCSSFVSLQKKSFTLMSWQDWILERGLGGTYTTDTTAPNLFYSEYHSHASSNGWSEKNNMQIIKIVPPFRIQTEEDIDWVLSYSPFAHQNLHIPSGIVNFKYTYDANFFIYNHNTNTGDVIFKAGDSILNYVPLSERRVKVHQHLDAEKYNYLLNVNQPLCMRNSYIKKKRFLWKS